MSALDFAKSYVTQLGGNLEDCIIQGTLDATSVAQSRKREMYQQACLSIKSLSGDISACNASIANNTKSLEQSGRKWKNVEKVITKEFGNQTDSESLSAIQTLQNTFTKKNPDYAFTIQKITEEKENLEKLKKVFENIRDKTYSGWLDYLPSMPSVSLPSLNVSRFLPSKKTALIIGVTAAAVLYLNGGLPPLNSFSSASALEAAKSAGSTIVKVGSTAAAFGLKTLSLGASKLESAFSTAASNLGSAVATPTVGPVFGPAVATPTATPVFGPVFSTVASNFTTAVQ